MKKIRLKRKHSTLYLRTNYLIPIDSCVNTIREYDIRKANLSMFKEYNALDDKTIKKIEKMDNKNRKVYIGILKRDNKKLVKIEKAGILSSKEDLFANNNIQDDEVLSIKNDAVFIIGRVLKNTTISDNIEFVLKNTYTSYHRINKIEFYHNGRQKILHCKGVSDSLVERHENGIPLFLSRVFTFIEKDRRDDLRKYLIAFANDYKERKLPKEYYKEFNSFDCYRIDGIGDNALLLDDISPEFIQDINIVYNYKAFILPILVKYI